MANSLLLKTRRILFALVGCLAVIILGLQQLQNVEGFSSSPSSSSSLSFYRSRTTSCTNIGSLHCMHYRTSATFSSSLIKRRCPVPLGSSSTNGEKDDSSNNKPSSSPRRVAALVVHKLKAFFTTMLRRLVLLKARTQTNFNRLSKRTKIVVTGYLVAMGLVFGAMGRQAYIQRTSPEFPINSRRPMEITYSSFMDIVESQQGQPQGHQSPTQSQSQSQSQSQQGMDKVKIAPDRIFFRLSKPSPSEPNKVQYLQAYTRKVPASSETIDFLRSNRLDFTAATKPSNNIMLMYALRSAMFTLYALFLYKMYQTMKGATGGGSGSGANSDTPGKLLGRSAVAGNTDNDGRPLASFTDIQGIDDAKIEVMELVDTLRNPDKYSILGARAPTGLLLEGPPGTGKTMLARATAASAGVPLLYCSGSDFIELYVGRGAGRVRRMFERAQKLAPCIIFIDELDTLGKARDSGSGNMFGNIASGSRANDEAEQTLNQLLSCMDGLDSSRRICVLAATNRREVLDPALIRPGRFDRIVTLKLPDAVGRENILRVHAEKLPGFEEGSGIDADRKYSLGKGNKVDLGAVAAITEGLSGAELEFVVNEAAIRAVRRVSAALREGKDPKSIAHSHVTAEDFEQSIANFFATRRKNTGGGAASEVWKNVFK